MGMSTHVEGFKPPDELWRKHKAVWDACKAAGVQAPSETLQYFNHERPDDSGVKLDQPALGDAVKVYEAEMQNGFEIDIRKLPKDVVIVRVVNSW